MDTEETKRSQGLGVRGQEFGDLKPQASSLLSPQMDTDGTGKPDLTRESATEEGPGGTGKNVETSKRRNVEMSKRSGDPDSTSPDSIGIGVEIRGWE